MFGMNMRTVTSHPASIQYPYGINPLCWQRAYCGTVGPLRGTARLPGMRTQLCTDLRKNANKQVKLGKTEKSASSVPAYANAQCPCAVLE